MLDLMGGFKNHLKVYTGYRSCNLGNIQKRKSVPCVKKITPNHRVLLYMVHTYNFIHPTQISWKINLPT